MSRLALCALVLCAALLAGARADDVLVNEHGHDEADNDMEIRYDVDEESDRNADADTFSHFEFREARADESGPEQHVLAEADADDSADGSWVTPDMQSDQDQGSQTEAQLLETQASSRALFRSLHTRARHSSRTYASSGIGPSGSGGSSLASQSSIVTGSAPASGVPDAVVSSSITKDADGSKTLGGSINLPPGSDESSPGVVNTGSSRIHTDREGHHFIVLTNNNVLAQTVPDTAQQILAAAAAQSVAKQILDMARRRAVVQSSVVSEATNKQQVKTQSDRQRQIESSTDATAEASLKEQAAEAARKRLIVTLQAPFAAYGEGFIEPKASRIDTLCVLEGMVRGPGGLVGVLGPDCRPLSRLTFSAIRTNQQARVDVMPDGRVFVIAGGADGFLVLSGIEFIVGAPDKEVELVDKWVAFGAPFRTPSVSKVGDVCVVSGVAKTTSGSWDKGIGNVPMECWPTQRLVFSTSNHVKQARIDVLPTGQIAWVAGGKDHNWVSLDGISYCAQDGGVTLSLDPKGGWEAYSNEYRKPKYCIYKGHCLLSGLVKNDRGLGDPGWAGLIAQLPEQCRPAKQAPFLTVGHGDSFIRVDVFPDGQIRYATGRIEGNNYLSLDGIRFMSAQVANLNAGAALATQLPSSSVPQPSPAIKP